jgi:transposase
MLYRWDFHRSKKGGWCVGKTKRGKGTKVMAVADRSGLPVSIYEESATPHEVTLVEQTIEARFTQDKPVRLIGDKAYDSDGLDKKLKEQGIEMIAPNRENRVKPGKQDGRPLRRYKRRWKIERLFAWFGNSRHLAMRFEYYAANFFGFVQLACILILLRAFLR